MSYNNNEDDDRDKCNLKNIDVEDLKQVEQYLFLGFWFNTCEKDIDIRIGKKRTALRKMGTTRKSKLSTPIKL